MSAEPPAPPAPLLGRRGVLRLLLLAGGLGAASLLSRSWPRDQTVHYVLGDGAPRVLGLAARWAAGVGEDWTREASFRYPPGQAPRVVTHEPRLPDGEYTVEIDITATDTSSTVRRRVKLAGGATSIDLGQAVPR